MKFFEWEIEMNPKMKPYMDMENRRVAILTKEDDEIHMTMELDEQDRLVFHPRWNCNVILLGEKHIRLTLNQED
ncbi:hypothetical protein [Sporosarcina sp. FSL W7-1283]|uniref:hypothetical protein n=1 Tax=Sporosarcina sp. FSL W7-1283 TaxID=2921560 RepID=UPI0030F78FB8